MITNATLEEPDKVDLGLMLFTLTTYGGNLSQELSILAAIKMTQKEISSSDLESMVTNQTLAERPVKIINSLPFKTMVGVVVITPMEPLSNNTPKWMTTNVILVEWVKVDLGLMLFTKTHFISRE